MSSVCTSNVTCASEWTASGHVTADSMEGTPVMRACVCEFIVTVLAVQLYFQSSWPSSFSKKPMYLWNKEGGKSLDLCSSKPSKKTITLTAVMIIIKKLRYIIIIKYLQTTNRHLTRYFDNFLRFKQGHISVSAILPQKSCEYAEEVTI